ncbi:MAG TPA: hypothetical protein VH558_02265 [Pseudolabrys sp.]
MRYVLRIVTAAGEDRKLETAFPSVDSAMIVGRSALRHGARQAIVEDKDGNAIEDCDGDQRLPALDEE